MLTLLIGLIVLGLLGWGLYVYWKGKPERKKWSKVRDRMDEAREELVDVTVDHEEMDYREAIEEEEQRLDERKSNLKER